MKNLYRKGKVHPSPSPTPTAPLICDHLSFLPATILSLTVFLSPEDKEVLAYLISSSPTTSTSTAAYGGSGSGGDHPTSFNCNCFRCYMSYWVRWDTSPNRQLIHEIIDAFEEESSLNNKKTEKKKNKKEIRRKKSKGSNGSGHELKRTEISMCQDFEVSESVSVKEESSSTSSGVGGEFGGGEEEDTEKDPIIRRFLNYIGENFGGFFI